MSPEPGKELMVRVARAIAPERDRFVVIGGAAHQLFRFMELAQSVTFPVLRTLDADVAVDTNQAHFSLRVDERLAHAGFRAVTSGDDSPPATHYVLEGSEGHYVQFVAHRSGSAIKRGGRRDATVIIAGVVAEKLSHVDLLLQLPWSLELKVEHGFPVNGEQLSLQVANAASYLAQKLLIRRDRADARAKDIVYVYDTLLLFARALPQLRDLWREIESPKTKRSREVIQRALAMSDRHNEDLFGSLALLDKLGRRDVPGVDGLAQVLREGLRSIFDRALA